MSEAHAGETQGVDEVSDGDAPRRMGYTVDTGEWSFPDNDLSIDQIYKALEGFGKYRQSTMESLAMTEVPASKSE